MSQVIWDVKPLDPKLQTGPTRRMSGVTRMRAVTPGTPYGEFASWLYVGVTGDVNILEWDGTSITLTGLAAGVWHPIASLSVNTSGTTATGLCWGS